MGIKNLIKLLNAQCGSTAIKKYDFVKFSNMTVAVDTSTMIYQTVLAVRASGSDMVNRNGELTSHLHGILYKVLKFLEYGITPIFVFDGKAPILKNKTSDERNTKIQTALDLIKKMGPNPNTSDPVYIKNFLNAFRPTKAHNLELQLMLNLMGIPFICAEGEADVICAWLASRSDPNTSKRYAKGVCSDDSDMLAFGAEYLFKDMCKQRQVTVVSLRKCLAKMDITQDQFIDLCVLLGCDHCSNIPGIGPAKVYPNIVDHIKLEKIIKLYKQKNPKLESESNFDFNQMILARNYFKTALNEIDNSDFIITDLNSKLRASQPDELFDFLCTKHSLDTSKVESCIDRLKMYQTKMNITTPNPGSYHIILQPKTETDGFDSTTEEEPKPKKLKAKIKSNKIINI